MQVSYPEFDRLVTEQFPDAYRLCFLLTASPSDAWPAAFQAFLYMGTQAELYADSGAEQAALFGWCIYTCRDYYYRKMRRRPRRAKFEKTVPFPVSGPLWELLRLPFGKKAEIFLIDYLGLSQEYARRILNMKPGTGIPSSLSGSPSSLSGSPYSHSGSPSGHSGGPGLHGAYRQDDGHGIPDGCAAPAGGFSHREAITSIQPPENGAGQMVSELYLRFEERNVPLENKLRRFRLWWDRAVIWIAAVILVLFAAAAYYTAHLGF